MYFQTTITPVPNALTPILTPTVGKRFMVKYLTFNLSVDLFNAVEIYLGAVKIYTQAGCRAGVTCGFNLDRNYLLGDVNAVLAVRVPDTTAINVNVTYKEK